MARIYIVRHGETHALRQDYMQRASDELSDEGREQAQRLAERFKNETLDLLLCSPFVRTEQTGDAIHTHHSRTPRQTWDQIRERSYGIFEGKPFEAYNTAWKASGQPREEYRPPQGENYSDVYERAHTVWKRVHKLSKKNNTILIVSHSVWISHFIAAALDKNLEGVIELRDLQKTPTSVNLLTIKGYTIQPVYLGDSSHLNT